MADRGLADGAARRQLADEILLFADDNRSAAEIAQVALQKFGI
jgi:hypothetical protein